MTVCVLREYVYTVLVNRTDSVPVNETLRRVRATIVVVEK
jgi:hypothetical protein